MPIAHRLSLIVAMVAMLLLLSAHARSTKCTGVSMSLDSEQCAAWQKLYDSLGMNSGPDSHSADITTARMGTADPPRPVLSRTDPCSRYR